MTDRAVERPPSRIDAVAETVALIGGVLLIVLATMVVVSVTLRSDLVGKAGVPGDFELVQMATAVAAFCFLPLCQLKRGNIFVDTFTLKLPPRWRDGLDALWDVVYGLAMALIAGGSESGLARRSPAARTRWFCSCRAICRSRSARCSPASSRLPPSSAPAAC